MKPAGVAQQQSVARPARRPQVTSPAPRSTNNAGGFYLEPVVNNEPLPPGVALAAFAKTCGDTVGVVYVLDDGQFNLWCKGDRIGTFDSVNAIYARLLRMDV